MRDEGRDADPGQALQQRCGESGFAAAAVAPLLAALALVLCATPARAVILPAQTIDGPSEDIVGFGGVAMAEDGTGGLVYLKRVGGRRARVRLALRRRPLAGADPGRHRRAVRGQLAAHRRRRRRRAGRRVGDAVRDRGQRARRRAARRDARSRRLGFGPAQLIDPDIRDGTGTSPDLAMSSTGQADVVYRVVNNEDEPTGQRIPAAAPRRRRRGSARRALRRRDAGLRSARSTATRGSRCARRPKPTRRRSRSARPATGSSSGRSRTSNGVARIWARRLFGTHARLRAAGQRHEPTRGADRRRRRRAERGHLAARPGRGRLPPGGRPGLAAAGAAHLPEHAARRRIGQTAPSSRARASSTRGVSGGAGATVGPPSIDIDEQRDAAPALRRQRHAARDRRQRPGACRGRSRSDPRSPAPNRPARAS